MIRVLSFVLKLALLLSAAIWLAEQDSSVILDWRGYRFETNTAFLFVLAVAIVLIISGIARVWGYVTGAPRRVLAWREESKIHTGLSAYTKGLVAIAMGNPEEAKRQAEKTKTNLPKHEGLGHLLAAQAATLSGDHDAAQQSLKAMADAKDDAAFLGIRGLLSNAIREGDLKRALKLTNDAQKLEPKSPWIYETRLNLYARLGQWIDAEKIIKQMQKSKFISSDVSKTYQSYVSLELSKEALEQGRRDDALSYARDAAKLNESFAPIAVHYASIIAAEGRANRAASIIEKAWKKSPHPLLANYFYQLSVGLDPADQYKKMQKLIKLHPDHRDSLMVQASLEAERGHYQQARDALYQLLDTEPTTGVYKMLSTIEEKQNGNVKAIKEWLDKIPTADPDYAWVCDSCRHGTDIWSATCPHCMSFGKLKWAKPSKSANQNQPLNLLLTGTI